MSFLLKLPKVTFEFTNSSEKFFVTKLIIPPIEFCPYKDDTGPFTTSTLSMKSKGIPFQSIEPEYGILI